MNNIIKLSSEIKVYGLVLGLLFVAAGKAAPSLARDHRCSKIRCDGRVLMTCKWEITIIAAALAHGGCEL